MKNKLKIILVASLMLASVTSFAGAEDTELDMTAISVSMNNICLIHKGTRVVFLGHDDEYGVLTYIPEDIKNSCKRGTYWTDFKLAPLEKIYSQSSSDAALDIISKLKK